MQGSRHLDCAIAPSSALNGNQLPILRGIWIEDPSARMATELLVGAIGNLPQLSNEVSMALAGTALWVLGALVRRLA
jgi:hypothetical protein